MPAIGQPRPPSAAHGTDRIASATSRGHAHPTMSRAARSAPGPLAQPRRPRWPLPPRRRHRARRRRRLPPLPCPRANTGLCTAGPRPDPGCGEPDTSTRGLVRRGRGCRVRRSGVRIRALTDHRKGSRSDQASNLPRRSTHRGHPRRGPDRGRWSERRHLPRRDLQPRAGGSARGRVLSANLEPLRLEAACGSGQAGLAVRHQGRRTGPADGADGRCARPGHGHLPSRRQRRRTPLGRPDPTAPGRAAPGSRSGPSPSRIPASSGLGGRARRVPSSRGSVRGQRRLRAGRRAASGSSGWRFAWWIAYGPRSRCAAPRFGREAGAASRRSGHPAPTSAPGSIGSSCR